MADPAAHRRRIAWAVTADAVAIIVFVALGRQSHDEGGNALTATLTVAAPFLIGAAVGWLAARAWRAPLAAETGVAVWLATVIVGMVMRHVVFDRGTATPFIIVASLFTMLFLIGWRVVAGQIAHRRSTPEE